jgi:prepilin-type N-terminal cleavage/methylation domain-containing protein
MKKNGFTLIEVLIAIILVGVAIASLIAANISFTRANSVGTNLSTAEFLIEQIRELTAMLPVVNLDKGTPLGPEAGETLTNYNDVDDFDGFNSTNLSAPINASREPLSNFAEFSQQVTVQKVDNTNFGTVVADTDTSSHFVRVTVKILLNGKEISEASWIRAQY